MWACASHRKGLQRDVSAVNCISSEVPDAGRLMAEQLIRLCLWPSATAGAPIPTLFIDTATMIKSITLGMAMGKFPPKMISDPPPDQYSYLLFSLSALELSTGGTFISFIKVKSTGPGPISYYNFRFYKEYQIFVSADDFSPTRAVFLGLCWVVTGNDSSLVEAHD